MIPRLKYSILIFSTLLMVLSAAVLFCYGDVSDESDIEVGAGTACVVDAGSNTFLYDKKADARMYPASCTKVMTALVVLENCGDLGETVTVSSEAISIDDPESNNIYLEAGEKLSVRDLLYALLLYSANDAANVLAEHIGGTVGGFVDMMNERAAEMKLTDTHFTNPHGLFDEHHYTTARDLAKITAEATGNREFMNIIGTREYTIAATNKSPRRVIDSHHPMVADHEEYDKDVIGGKTGFVGRAKYSMVTIAESGGMTLILVTMRGDSYRADAEDTKKLLDYCRDNFRPVDLPIELDRVSSEKIKDLDVYTEDKVIHATLRKDQSKDSLTTEVRLAKGLSMPIKKDQAVGTAVFRIGDDIQGTTVIRAASPRPDHRLTLVSSIMTTLTGLILLILLKRKKRAKV